MHDPNAVTSIGPGPPGLGGHRPSAARALALGAALSLLLLCGGAFFWAHNDMLARAEAIDAAWAQVESNYQRRADLVPRLVKTVTRYMRHEETLLMGVAKERASVQHALVDLDRARSARDTEPGTGAASAPADASELEALAQREAQLGRGFHAVLAVAEGYPELRSADQFLELQAQLEGAENRINVARMAFNDAVREYNAALVQIPTRFIAESRGLERRPYFEADPVARIAGPLDLE